GAAGSRAGGDADVRVLIVSGIWPPDVGGPASHAPEVAGFLRGRGHSVEVVTTADREPPPADYSVHWVDRANPVGVRHLGTAALIRRRAAANDVVYTTGMFARRAAGSLLAGMPFVVDLTADPAYERSRRRGFFAGSLEDFQDGGGGHRSWVLRRARDAELGRAAHVFCPSEYLRRLAVGWGLPPERVSVLPNPVPTLPQLPAQAELREQLGVNGATLAFAGRLTPPKALAAAVQRFFGEAGLKERLRDRAASSVADYAPERVYGRLEEVLASVALSEAG